MNAALGAVSSGLSNDSSMQNAQVTGGAMVCIPARAVTISLSTLGSLLHGGALLYGNG